jgi:DNA-binding response OmpR family regulator
MKDAVQSADPAPLVLVVDDDEGARLLTQIALSNAEFRVVQAENGKDALDVFQAERPDIVLLDVNMPVMDGFDACRGLRQLPGGETVPVLMLTGHEDIESINRAYEVGATDFLTKSNNWEMIAHRVRYMLRAARAFSELEKNRENLSSTQRIARMGGWEWRAQSDRF